jgi:hypothetical protein
MLIHLLEKSALPATDFRSTTSKLGQEAAKPSLKIFAFSARDITSE